MEKYTDQEFFYKQTPVNYDGIAKFTSIKGNTLGWNQLVKNGNFANGTTDWYGASATISVSNGVCRATIGSQAWNNDIRQNMVFVPNHKFLFSCDYRISSANVGELVFTVGDSNSGTTRLPNTTVKTRFVSFLNPTDSGTSRIRFSTASDQSSNQGEWYEVSNVYLIDLTQMGLDSITSVDEFTSLFPLPYYDYNQGTLLSFNGTGIKTVGFNQWDEEWELGGYNTNGEKIADNNRIRNKNFVPLISGLTYYFKSPTVVGVRFYDGNKVFLGTSYNIANDNFLFTAPSNACYLCFSVTNTTSYGNNVCINISSSKNGTYEPYISTTTDLPISNYFPTGMKSAWSVYDELTESKAITRIGRVDLGTLNWAYSSADATHPLGFFYTTSIASRKGGATNLKCAKFVTSTSWSTDKSIQGNANNYAVYVVDSAYTDATTFKNSLSGVYLYYELATETETDAEDIFYKFYADGTEQLLPVNGSTPTTSYIIADIEYYDSTEGDSLYRRFWLINGDGERWDLTDKEFKSFLNNPTGLGFRKTIEVTRYGEKANKNNEVYDFPQPSGELLFYDTYNSTRYDKYNKFIRFLMSQPITLYYMIPVSYISGIANIFTLDCDVTEVQKTESKTDHILTSSIVFNGLGFYEGDEISVNGTTDTYTLTNEGDFPVGFEITVEGNMTNPYITLSQDGELYGEAKFDSATAFNSLYLNSNDGEQNIILQQGGSVIPNPLSYQDLSISNGSIYVTFVKLAKGVSELSIGMESGSITNVNIKYSSKYRSV